MYKVVVFDAYGTLLDVDSAAMRLAATGDFPELEACWKDLSSLWRARQLNYSWLRSLSNSYISFWQITCDGLDYALETMGLADDRLHTALLDLYRQLDAYEDAGHVLDKVQQAGLPAAVLSNGNHAMLRQSFDSAGLTQKLDKLLSVEDVGIFKPAPEVYQLVCSHYDLDTSDVLFVSSNGWDAAAASQFGFTTLWANRSGLPVERLAQRPDYISPDLYAVADLLAAK